MNFCADKLKLLVEIINPVAYLHIYVCQFCWSLVSWAHAFLTIFSTSLPLFTLIKCLGCSLRLSHAMVSTYYSS